MEVKFVIKSIKKVSKFEKDFIIKAFQIYYQKKNGYDLKEAFIKVTKFNSLSREKNEIIDAYASNYNKAVLLCNSFTAKEKILLIYKDSLLSGCAKIKEEAQLISVSAISILENDKDSFKKIGTSTIEFIEAYYRKQNFNKINIEIALKEVTLLMIVANLGYREEEEDITIDADNDFYIYSKYLK